MHVKEVRIHRRAAAGTSRLDDRHGRLPAAAGAAHGEAIRWRGSRARSPRQHCGRSQGSGVAPHGPSGIRLSVGLADMPHQPQAVKGVRQHQQDRHESHQGHGSTTTAGLGLTAAGCRHGESRESPTDRGR